MSMLALGDVLSWSGGTLEGELAESTAFPRVELDPGKVQRGDLFVAVPGERVDGHEFTVVAALRGAAAAVVAQRWRRRVEQLPLPLIVVDDPLVALQQLAAGRRERLAATVVGVTGSVGKSTTKEVVASVLAQRFTTYRSPGNRNNEIGLPLSLLEIEPETEVAVLEMGGAYAPGELELLAKIAKPRIAVVTNVFPVHLERMGSIEAIAETKAELVEAVPADGFAVLNGDDPRVRAMSGRCRGRVLTYGLSSSNDIWADALATHGLEGCSFELNFDGERHRLQVPLVGDYAVELVLAAFAVGRVLGMSVEEMIPGVEDPAVQIRLRRVPGANGSLLLDDTYNASAPGVLSALKLLGECPASRRIAVLGDMLELGSVSEDEHRAVGRRAATVDLLVTYGDLAHVIAAEAAAESNRVGSRPPTFKSFAPRQRDELVDFLRAELHPGDVVLIKGSRALRMEELVEALCG